MTRDDSQIEMQRIARELSASHEGIPQLWGRRGSWQVRLRWGVAPVILFGVLIAQQLGFELPVVPIVLIAFASPIYNFVFVWIFSRYSERLEQDPKLDRFLTMLEVIADYAAMFLLIHFTGGVTSPLVLFLLFHVIIAAIQFASKVGYLFALFAAGGLWLLFAAQVSGIWSCHGLMFRGEPFLHSEETLQSAVMLLFFTATLFLSAALVSRIMLWLRRRVGDLAEVTTELGEANEKLNSLYAIVCSIGAQRRLDPILSELTRELAKVMRVRAVAVKLLSEDGETLRFVSAHGLPQELVDGAVVHLDQSPLNRRIMEGETLVHGRLDEDVAIHLHQQLESLGIRSAVMAPLEVEDRVIGTLGIYSRREDRFRPADSDFLQLAAKLTAIAIEDALTNEALEDMMHERTQFMLQVAHNMRAPLGAGLSMLELLKDGYLGDISDRQSEYLQRVDVRLRSLDQAIGELLAIAKARDWSREIPDVVVDLADLAEHTRRIFKDEAAVRKVRFEVREDADLPSVDSGSNLLEQVMENLVSNAIKYTPPGGEVEVDFTRQGENEVEITVRDTGIGIPESEQEKLFQEFFRASNARKHTTTGTGLGLALVKQTVERHSGSLSLTSREGSGTTIVVRIPIHQQITAQ